MIPTSMFGGMLLTDLVAKELEVFKEALPQARRFGVLFASTAPSHVPALEAAETAARQLAVLADALAVADHARQTIQAGPARQSKPRP